MLDDEQYKIVKRVHERITQFPDTHDQYTWYRTPEMAQKEEYLGEECIEYDYDDYGTHFLLALISEEEQQYKPVVDVETMNVCNTTACVAGHAVLAAYELGIPYRISVTAPITVQAESLMGLNGEQSDRLFHCLGNKEAVRAVERAADSGTWVGAFGAA